MTLICWKCHSGLHTLRFHLSQNENNKWYCETGLTAIFSKESDIKAFGFCDIIFVHFLTAKAVYRAVYRISHLRYIARAKHEYSWGTLHKEVCLNPPLRVCDIIGRFKSYTSYNYGEKLWQRSYYDHIIRGEMDYMEIWEYIDKNPHKWNEDELYLE